MRTVRRLLAVAATASIAIGATPTGAFAWAAWEFNYGTYDGMQLSDCADSHEISVDYGKGCFRETGDWFIVRDTKIDGMDPGVKWEHAASARRGVCRSNGGADPFLDRSCNKDLLEGTSVKYWLVRNNPANNPEQIANWVNPTYALSKYNDQG